MKIKKDNAGAEKTCFNLLQYGAVFSFESDFNSELYIKVADEMERGMFHNMAARLSDGEATASIADDDFVFPINGAFVIDDTTSLGIINQESPLYSNGYTKTEKEEFPIAKWNELPWVMEPSWIPRPSKKSTSKPKQRRKKSVAKTTKSKRMPSAAAVATAFENLGKKKARTASLNIKALKNKFLGKSKRRKKA